MATDREQVRIDDLQTAGYRCPYCGYCDASEDGVRKHISSKSDADHRDRNGFDISAVIEEIPDIEPVLVDELEADDLTEKQQATIVEYVRSPDKTYGELAEWISNRDDLPDISETTVGRTLREKCRIETGYGHPNGDKYSDRNERQQEAIDTLARRAHEAGGITSLEKLDDVDETGDYLYSVADRYSNLVMQRREELSEAPDPESLSPEDDPLANLLNNEDWYRTDEKDETSVEQAEEEEKQERIKQERGNVTYEGVPMDGSYQHIKESPAHQNSDGNESSEDESLEVEAVEETESSQQETVTESADVFAPIIVPKPEAEGVPAREIESLLDTIEDFRDLIQQDELDAEAALTKVEERLREFATDPDMKVGVELTEKAD